MLLLNKREGALNMEVWTFLSASASCGAIILIY
jgi:hypothetical protein